MAFPLISALIGGASSLIAARQSAKASKAAAGVAADTARENRAAAQTATDAGLSDFDAALNAAMEHLSGGASTAAAGYDTAAGYQQPYAQAGNQSLTELMSSLGLN